MIEAKWKIINDTCQEEDRFLRKSWFDAWARYIEENNNWNGKIQYELIEAGDGNCAILPYAFQTIGPFKFASIAGNFFPHRGIPHTGVKLELIERTVDRISEIKDIYGFRLGPIVQEDPFILKLCQTLTKNKWIIISKYVGHDFGMNLLTNKEDFIASVSSKRKGKINRCQRAMERDGKVELKHYTAVSQDQWAVVFNELAFIENHAWIAESGEPRFIGNANQDYWNALVTDEWFQQSLNVWILYFDDKPASYSMEMDTKDTRYGLSSSYVKEVAKYGTGVMLRYAIYIQAIDAGKTFLNDGLGDAGYKSEWGSEKISTLVDLVAFPPTLKGRIAYYMARLQKLVRK